MPEEGRFPWSVLGLEPDHADASTVRRAYARLVKVHRPDREPGRFQEIRQAYDAARRLLEHHAASGTPLEDMVVIDIGDGWIIGVRSDEADDGEGASYRIGAPASSPPHAPDREALEAAARSNDAAETVRLLTDARRRWLDPTVDAPSFPDWVAKVPEAYVDVVGDATAVLDCLRAACAGSPQLSLHAVRVWMRRGEWIPIVSLADRLLAHREVPDDPDAELGVVTAMAVCARALALTAPDRAERLADEAFRRLPPALRGSCLEDVDARLRMAAELVALSVAQRGQLTLLLDGVEDAVDAAGQGALRRALGRCREDGLTAAVLRQRLPALEPADFTPPTGVPPRKRSPAYVWLLVVGVAMAAFNGLAHRVTRRSASSPPGIVRDDTPRDQIPRFEDAADSLRAWQDQEDFPKALRVLLRTRGTREAGAEAAFPPDADFLRGYAQYPWLLEFRKQVEYSLALGDEEWVLLLDGLQAIRRNDIRYPIMLRVFLEDETLPDDVRTACRNHLEHYQRTHPQDR